MNNEELSKLIEAHHQSITQLTEAQKTSAEAIIQMSKLSMRLHGMIELLSGFIALKLSNVTGEPKEQLIAELNEILNRDDSRKASNN